MLHLNSISTIPIPPFKKSTQTRSARRARAARATLSAARQTLASNAMAARRGRCCPICTRIRHGDRPARVANAHLGGMSA